MTKTMDVNQTHTLLHMAESRSEGYFDLQYLENKFWMVLGMYTILLHLLKYRNHRYHLYTSSHN